MTKASLIYFGIAVLVGVLMACGAEKPSNNSPNPSTPNIVLTAPEYAISGQFHDLFARVEGLVEGQWEYHAIDGNFFNFPLMRLDFTQIYRRGCISVI